MAAFDPISALAGGALIGLASVLLMMLTGRIAGISGILGGVLKPAVADKGWRLAHQEEWLLRVLDPGAALRQRGYHAHQACLLYTSDAADE